MRPIKLVRYTCFFLGTAIFLSGVLSPSTPSLEVKIYTALCFVVFLLTIVVELIKRSSIRFRNLLFLVLFLFLFPWIAFYASYSYINSSVLSGLLTLFVILPVNLIGFFLTVYYDAKLANCNVKG